MDKTEKEHTQTQLIDLNSDSKFKDKQTLKLYTQTHTYTHTTETIVNIFPWTVENVHSVDCIYEPERQVNQRTISPCTSIPSFSFFALLCSSLSLDSVSSWELLVKSVYDVNRFYGSARACNTLKRFTDFDVHSMERKKKKKERRLANSTQVWCSN